MPAESVYLLAVLAGALLLLYKGWVRHDVTALLVMLATMVPWIPEDGGLRGVLPVEDAVAGFGSPALVMVAAMFVDPGDPTRVFTKEELLRDVWGFKTRGHSRTLDSHAIRLRMKLRAITDVPWITNVWGVGYRLAPVGPHEGERGAA